MNEPDERWSFDGATMGIWHDAPVFANRRTAAIGEFACDDAARGGAALRTAAERLHEAGFGAALGPMNGSTWAQYRFVVESDGRPPFLMEPHNPGHYPHAFEQAGFEVLGRYFSADRPASMPASASRGPQGITLRALRLDDFEHELERLFELSLAAFAGNAFYTPITREQFFAIYRPMLPVIDPELVLLAEDHAGTLQGYLFGIANRAEGERPNSVILKTYASRLRGCGSMLANEFHARALAQGFERVIHALIHSDNLSAAHSRKLGGQIFRHYALWGRAL